MTRKMFVSWGKEGFGGQANFFNLLGFYEKKIPSPLKFVVATKKFDPPFNKFLDTPLSRKVAKQAKTASGTKILLISILHVMFINFKVVPVDINVFHLPVS